MKEGDIVKNTGHDAKGTEGFDYQFLYFINRKYSVNAVLCA